MLVSHTPIHKLRLSKVMLLKVRSPLADWVLWLTGLAVQTNWVTVNQVVIMFRRTELLDGVLQNCTRSPENDILGDFRKTSFCTRIRDFQKMPFCTRVRDFQKMSFCNRTFA